MTSEVTPDAPTICTLTGQDMTWNGQRWVHAEPHNFCAIHDTIGESPLSEPQARLVGFGEYTIRELQERSHQQSRDKGFHDYQPTDLREIQAAIIEKLDYNATRAKMHGGKKF